MHLKQIRHRQTLTDINSLSILHRLTNKGKFRKNNL